MNTQLRPYGLSRRTLLNLAISAVPVGFASTSELDAQTSVWVMHTRVFAAGKGGGNPCPVIVDQMGMIQGSSMQALARRFGLETVFIVPPQQKGAGLRLRYFVPDHEMGVSGHATIAAVTVALLARTLDHNPVRIETSSGMFEASWTRQANEYRITLEQNAPVFGSVTAPERAAWVLGIQAGDIASAESPVQSVSVSRAKLLVPLRDVRILNHLTPDFEALWRLCEEEQVSGLYPFTRHTEQRKVNAEARQFPLRAGFREDAATGVAAAALGAYLARYDLASAAGHHEFRIAQGYAMGAPSVIEATVDCSADGHITRTAIRGVAQIVRREEIRL